MNKNINCSKLPVTLFCYLKAKYLWNDMQFKIFPVLKIMNTTVTKCFGMSFRRVEKGTKIVYLTLNICWFYFL